jgi:hypothetical protein
MASQPLTDREFARLGTANGLVFASELEPAVGLLGAPPADTALPAVTVSLPVGVTTSRVFAAIAWRKQADSSGADNAVATNQQVQVRRSPAGAFANAINIPASSLFTGANAAEGGLLLMGALDISGEVDGEGTFEFQWLGAEAVASTLTLYDFQTYLVVEFS